MKVLIMSDDNNEGTTRIVINKIESYGLIITEYGGEINAPKWATVWVVTSHGNYNRRMSYHEALKFLKRLM